MMSVESKAVLLQFLVAVLIGLLVWPAGVPPGGEVARGWSGTRRRPSGESPLGLRFWTIRLARGPPDAHFRRMR